MNLSAHFTEDELSVGNADERIKSNARYLCEHILEPIRAQYALPLHITSGYRPPAKNEQVHGVHDSEHLYNDDHAACDFILPGIPLIQVFNWIRVVSQLPFRQVILERDHLTQEPHCIHISTRQNGNDKHEALIGATHNAEAYHVVECA